MKSKLLIFVIGLINICSQVTAQTTHIVNDETGVDNGVSPFATIAAAITAASANDIIDITGGSDNTHTEAAVTINKKLTIQGQGQNTTILQAAATQAAAEDGVFVVNNNLVVTFQNITIQNGNAVSTGTSTSTEGGGIDIFCGPSTNINFTNVTLTNNKSDGAGGGVYVFGTLGKIAFTDCILSNNISGGSGGAISNGGTTDLNLTRCSIIGNSASIDGGGVRNIRFNSVTTLINCTIADNTARKGGGVFLGSSTVSAEIINCTIVNNTLNTGTTRQGGGICQQGGDLDLINTIVANNSGASSTTNGDDIYADVSGITITQTTSLVEDCDDGSGTCATFSYSSDNNLATTASTCGIQSYFDITNSDAQDNGTVPSGNIPTTDICGNTRIASHDIGSFDLVASLPVELIYFKGRVTPEGNLLRWQTASEKNNEGFLIERSTDSNPDSYRGWENIGFIQGNGTIQTTQNYTFTDAQSFNGINYYRLKQIDFDGKFEYSNIISLQMEKQTNHIGFFYPNPSQSGLVDLMYHTQNEEQILFSVFDVSGKLVVQKSQQLSEGNNNLSFDFSNLNKGIYIIKIGNEVNPIHRKLIIK